MEKMAQLPAAPEAKRENMIQGNGYRITLLTEGLVRLEYDPDGLFEDRATQTVLNRDFPAGKGDGRRTGNQYLASADSLQQEGIYSKRTEDPGGGAHRGREHHLELWGRAS